MSIKSGAAPKSTIQDSRVLVYLNQDNTVPYVNTAEESELAQLWNQKYETAKAEYEKSRVNSRNVAYWRQAYFGNFNQLDENGNITDKKMKALQKVAYELVEQKVNPHIPAPKMKPRHFVDIIPVEATEALIKHELDKMLSEEVQDESEHSCLIDSTTWFKVTWDPFESTHERSGMPKIENCPIDTVYPQPGISDYRKLEYIFERKTSSTATILDLYGRKVQPDLESELVDIVEVYFLNENRHVGRFVYTEHGLVVLANDLEWAMRRRRECVSCSAINNIDDVCPVCGGTDFHYVSVKEQKLDQQLDFVTNPYRVGSEGEDGNVVDENKSIPVGTVIPYYLIRQLPFVPKRTVKVPKDIYGISEVQLQLEPQDAINKFLNKAERKSLSSKAVITKLKDTNIDLDDDEMIFVEIDDASQGQAIQVKQIMADIQQEMAMAQLIYQGLKSTLGVTDTDQGKNDPSARSGKAKQMQLAASQARQQAPTLQRNIAYAGVYELIFKYMLAFCDEDRNFIKTLPDGTSREETWSKYMFLDQDDKGNYFYRDDFAWSVDDATEITQDRASMWQLIDNDFINGTLGSQIDPIRALKLYWQLKKNEGYPLAKQALAFLEDSIQHLPTQIEQALVNNPDAVELAMSFIADMQKQAAGGSGAGGAGGAGGARDGAGKTNNGQTHEQQQAATNNKQRAADGQQTNTTAAATGGAQGGTGK